MLVSITLMAAMSAAGSASDWWWTNTKRDAITWKDKPMMTLNNNNFNAELAQTTRRN